LKRCFYGTFFMRADRKAEMARVDGLAVGGEIDTAPRRRHPFDTDKNIHNVGYPFLELPSHPLPTSPKLGEEQRFPPQVGEREPAGRGRGYPFIRRFSGSKSGVLPTAATVTGIVQITVTAAPATGPGTGGSGGSGDAGSTSGTGGGNLPRTGVEVLPMVALAGFLAERKITPATAGTFPVTTPLFVVLLVGVILIVGALTFFPALSLGPIVEHFLMLDGRLF